MQPVGVRRCGDVGFATAEHQDVGDDLGAGDPFECGRGQPHRADEVGDGVHVAARLVRGGIQRSGGGDRHDVAAGGGEVERLEQEVVVDAVAGRIVDRVVHGEPAERHIADHRGERAVRDAGGLETLQPHLGVGVEKMGDLGGRRVELHPHHLRAGRCQTDERAAATTRFEHQSLVETSASHRRPHRLGDRRIGVVGVECGGLRLTPLLRIQQGAQLVAFGCPLRLGLVEDVGRGTPPRPLRQDLVLGGRRRASGARCLGEDLECGDIGAGAGLGPGGHQHRPRMGEPGRSHHLGRCRGGGLVEGRDARRLRFRCLRVGDGVGFEAGHHMVGLDVDDRAVRAACGGDSGARPRCQRQPGLGLRHLRHCVVGLRWQRRAAGVDDGRVSGDPQIVQRLKQQSLAVVDYLRTRSASARS